MNPWNVQKFPHRFGCGIGSSSVRLTALSLCRHPNGCNSRNRRCDELSSDIAYGIAILEWSYDIVENRVLADQLLVVQSVVRQSPDRCHLVDLGSVTLGILDRLRVVNNRKLLDVPSLADRGCLLRIDASVDMVVDILHLLG